LGNCNGTIFVYEICQTFALEGEQSISAVFVGKVALDFRSFKKVINGIYERRHN